VTILWIEPIGGLSGDMFLAAGADLGLDLRELSELLKGAGLSGFGISSRREARGGIEGTRVDVELAERPHDRGEPHGHGRSWRDIRALLDQPTLQGPVGSLATRIFGRLAQVEAKIHAVPVEEVHFHEVGAVDSIVDIVGAAWILDRLKASKVLSAPPPLGSGLVKSEHGPIPVPAPATLALLQGLPALWEGTGELTTPTGAAILAECARFETPGAFTAQRVGYGVGHATWPDRPNLLRLTLGTGGSAATKPVGLLEAHLDDASPQLLGHLVERLLEQGALDVSLGPLLMKKNRPGQRLTVVCQSVDRERLSDLILRESTSLGVRWSEVERVELERRFETVETEYGSVRIKLGLRRGEIWNVAPEYDDCAALARGRGVPLKLVLGAAAAAGQRLLSRK
jgi:pyridinium-3,5-bisthiocarboxylic acid mononucleotide nickel chelatase